MKPPKEQQRPLNEIRVTRKTTMKVEGGDGHGWAVSYADLLMVLLSFFVIFFSLEEEDPSNSHNQLRVIAAAMKGKPSGKHEFKSTKTDGLSDLTEALKVDGLKVTIKDDVLLVDLENGVFLSGAWKADANLKKQVDMVLEQIAPFKDKLSITIIGHADTRPMKNRNEYLSDNFDLSSLRALNILKYVLTKGIPATQASARAASSNDRDARSVTFELRLKKAEERRTEESSS